MPWASHCDCVLSDRKYQGSYQRVAELLRQMQLHSDNLQRFFEQVALCIMVRNGAAHLKNFGVLYLPLHAVPGRARAGGQNACAQALCRQARQQGLSHRRRAPRLRTAHLRRQPTPQVLDRIAQAMRQTLQDARQDARVPASLLQTMGAAWETGLHYAT